ncbi:hypothetical protein C6499_06175, partial [Candidatus Poribacteria bacterium]
MVSNLSILPCFAQYAAHTQLSLPEGAKARLGKGSINEIAYSPDGSLLAVASRIGTWLYDTETSEALALLTGHTGGVTNVSFSPDGTILASAGGSFDRTVRLWDVGTGTLKSEITTGHLGDISSISFSPDGTTLASG